MQYVEGQTLAERIQQGRIQTAEALTIAIQICNALAEAHKHGIIHRDMKPQNIMITDGARAKVMDFGLAKIVGDDINQTEAETQSLLTGQGVILGTVPYMSPEQVKGQTLDARTDIFSFGVLLYEMITGKRPFSAENAAALASAILTENPPPLSHDSRDVPEELEAIVRKCLEKDREQRYQAISDVANDLSNIGRTQVAFRIRPKIVRNVGMLSLILLIITMQIHRVRKLLHP
jgi:eukaryotic-like serine/threonine-protein kinase